MTTDKEDIILERAVVALALSLVAVVLLITTASRATSTGVATPSSAVMGSAVTGSALSGSALSGSAGARQATARSVTVSVYDDGAPLADRWVVFHDAAGEILAETKSGQDGKASADVPPDAMVTVAYGKSVYHLVTVTGVQPGDAIVIGETEDEGGAARVAGTAKVKLPGAHRNATRYTVSLGVGATDVPHLGEPLPVPVARRFLTAEQRFRVLAEALGSNGEPLAYALDWGALPGDVRLAAWSTDWRPVTLALSGIPAGLTAVDADLAILANERDRFERPRATIRSPSEPSQLRFVLPRSLAGDVAFRLELAYGGSPDKAVLAQSVAQLADTTPIDLRGALLPRVSSAVIETTDAPTRPAVRYQTAGDPSQADVAVVRLSWPETNEHVWTILTPPAASTRVRVPALPASLREWQPSHPATCAVALVEASFYAGFDDVRHKGLAEISEGPENGEPSSYRYSATGDITF